MAEHGLHALPAAMVRWVRVWGALSREKGLMLILLLVELWELGVV